MKRENLMRLARFKAHEQRRQYEQLQLMLREFERMAADLNAQITGEEQRSGITDIAHFAYPTFAKAARARRDNLMNSVRDLKVQIETAERACEEAEAELDHVEKLEQRDVSGERREAFG